MRQRLAYTGFVEAYNRGKLHLRLYPAKKQKVREEFYRCTKLAELTAYERNWFLKQPPKQREGLFIRVFDRKRKPLVKFNKARWTKQEIKTAEHHATRLAAALNWR